MSGCDWIDLAEPKRDFVAGAVAYGHVVINLMGFFWFWITGRVGQLLIWPKKKKPKTKKTSKTNKKDECNVGKWNEEIQEYDWM